MSHLIIEQGREVGTEVTVPAEGMKFGRSPANDLILGDDSVMLFHGRFFFKSDGSLWVTDFGAGEKTTVGGLPVDEHPLKTGDLVEVGATAFRVINAKETAGESPAAGSETNGAAEKSADDFDLGLNAASKKKNKGAGPPGHKKGNARTGSSLTNRVIQVSISLVILGVLIVVALEAVKLSEPTKSQIAPARNTLSLNYERVQADTRNIFRYQLDLDEQGHFKVVVDDLKNNRHIQKETKVSETMMLQLASQLDDTGCFDVGTDRIGIADDQYDLYDLTIKRNRRYHHIRVLNRHPPMEIKRAASIIEDFALNEVRVLFTFLKDPDDLRRYAEQSFQLGEARYAERDLRYSNLAEAVTHYQEAMLYLGTFEPKPVLYHNAEEGLKMAEDLRDERYEDYMFRADRAIRLSEWDEAAKFLSILSELVPERSDPRYDKISSKKLNVEKYLR